MNTPHDVSLEFNRRAAFVLVRARTGGEALRSLFELCPHLGNRSVSQISRNSGFGSRSALHNVLAGRRTLSVEGASALGKYLKLDLFNRKLLLALAALDTRTTATMRRRAERELATLRRLARQNRFEVGNDIRAEDYLFFALVKTAFDLYESGATMEQLLGILGKDQERRVSRVLVWGIKHGLVKEHAGRYRYRYRFSTTASSNPGKVRQVLRESLLLASRSLDQIDFRSEETFFRGSFVSVKREDFQRELQQFIYRVREFETKVERENGDEVVQIGVHIFPVLRKESA